MCHGPLIRFDTSSVSVWLAMADAAKSETLAWGRMGRAALDIFAILAEVCRERVVMHGLTGVQLKKSYTCRDSFMNVIIPHCSRLGQRAFAGCSLCHASGLLRPVTAGTLSSICKAGRALEYRCSRLVRGSRRLSAGTPQNSYRSQPSRRDNESKVKREVKKTVFSHGALKFYATCHPGLSHHQLHA